MSTSLRQQSCLWKVWTEGQIYENSWTVFDVGSNICHAQWHVQGGAGNISNLIQTQMNLDEFVHFCWPSHLKEDCTNIFKLLEAQLLVGEKTCSLHVLTNLVVQ